jgi:hypothetical protein
MGNACSSHKHKRTDGSSDSETEDGLEYKPEEREHLAAFNNTSLLFLPYKERNEQMKEWLKEIQKHNLEVMKEEFKNDLHGFILNNLLLCVQFMDNFET